MPYIERHLRPPIDAAIDALAPEQMSVGQLNYAITRMVLKSLPPRPRYADYNAAVGLLECAKLELYREQVARYEDAAKVAHGPLA